jgi:hypothetical protein
MLPAHEQQQPLGVVAVRSRELLRCAARQTATPGSRSVVRGLPRPRPTPLAHGPPALPNPAYQRRDAVAALMRR